jgi:thiamine-monophosphate kinase
MREFEVIARIRENNTELDASVVVPPGDDLGAVKLPDGGGVVLAGVDQVIGGVHLAHDATPEHFAWKVAARSLSDVAAMAACPVGMVVAAALPPGINTEWTTRFSQELQRIAALFECPLFGGDIAVLPSSDCAMVLSSTVLAAPDAQAGARLVLRSGARPGDRLCVTGSFGHALKADGSGHHQDFEPRIQTALELHRLFGADLSSMIDVSDGLGSEVDHLSCESQVSIIVDVALVPRRDGASVDAAFTDGEDYELCFTVSGGASIPDSLGGVPLAVIGVVREGTGVFLKDGEVTTPLVASGWEHRSGNEQQKDQSSPGGPHK